MENNLNPLAQARIWKRMSCLIGHALVTLACGYIRWRYRLSTRHRMGRYVRIWPGTVLGPGTHVDDNVEIGRPTDAGQPVSLTNAIDLLSRRAELPTLVGNGSRLRRNSTIYAGAQFGENLSLGHNVVVRERCVFGDDAYIKAYTYVGVDVRAGARVTIAGLVGDRSILQDDVTSLGSLVHRSRGAHRGAIERGPTLRSGVFIGRNSVVAGPVIVGKKVYVNAGCVIKSDVEDGTRVTGG